MFLESCIDNNDAGIYLYLSTHDKQIKYHNYDTRKQCDIINDIEQIYINEYRFLYCHHVSPIMVLSDIIFD